MRTLNSYPVELVTSSGRLLFKGPTDKDGYGQITAGKTHRLAWEETNGVIPEGLHVLHKCDVPCCINPAHLYLGTHQDNMADMKEKGRVVAHKGRLHGNALLTEAAVKEIREGKEPFNVLAEKYGVSKSTVQHIWYDRTRWRRVT